MQQQPQPFHTVGPKTRADLAQVQNLIDERAEKLEGTDVRWPQAGDMAHVAGKLAEILEFLKG